MIDGHHAFANGCCVQSSTSALHPGHSLVHVGMAEAHAVPRFVHSVVQRGVALSDDCALWVAGRGRVSRLRQPFMTAAWKLCHQCKHAPFDKRLLSPEQSQCCDFCREPHSPLPPGRRSRHGRVALGGWPAAPAS